MRKRKDARRKHRWTWSWGYALLASLLIYVSTAFKQRSEDLVVGKTVDNDKTATKEEIAKAVARAKHDHLPDDLDTEFQFMELTGQI